METMTKTKNCLLCGEPLRGRIDKKYCNDYCRNLDHNNSAQSQHAQIRPILNRLRKNHKVLSNLRSFDRPIGRDELLGHGFTFDFFTHQRGDLRYCFDIGYRLKGNTVTIVGQ